MLKVQQSWIPMQETELSLEEFVNEYRKIYQEAQALFDKYNPCRVRGGVCYRAQTETGTNFCCDGCEYLADDGCTAEALWCKVWSCHQIKGKVPGVERSMHPDMIEPLNALVNRADRLCHGRGGRRDISYYIGYFFGEEELERWKIAEASSKDSSRSTSTLSARC